MAENYDQMRRDAIHRAQEMQRRAQPQGNRRPPPGYTGSAMAGGGTPKKQGAAKTRAAAGAEAQSGAQSGAARRTRSAARRTSARQCAGVF